MDPWLASEPGPERKKRRSFSLIKVSRYPPVKDILNFLKLLTLKFCRPCVPNGGSFSILGGSYGHERLSQVQHVPNLHTYCMYSEPHLEGGAGLVIIPGLKPGK